MPITDGQGFVISWTKHGGLSAVAFKDWRRRLALGKNDERPLILDMLAHNISPHPASDPETMNSALRP